MAVTGGFVAVIGFLLVLFFSNLQRVCFETCPPPSVNWGQLSLILLAIAVFFLGLFMIASAVRRGNRSEARWQKPVFSLQESHFSGQVLSRA